MEFAIIVNQRLSSTFGVFFSLYFFQLFMKNSFFTGKEEKFVAPFLFERKKKQFSIRIHN